MARSTTLFLIRHGETVDNVAQVYAGSRDSALTNHGYLQAQRLGVHLHALGLRFTHIYSSHLQRAAKTASLIRDAQTGHPDKAVPDVIHLPVLMEKDFGYLEGKRWDQVSSEVRSSGTGQSPGKHKSVAGFIDVESKDSMARRADTFLDDHLLPLLNPRAELSDHVIAIVSHGMMLSALWKRLLLRLPSKSISFSPVLAAIPRVSLEHLGAWSNTGYLELHMSLAPYDLNTAPDSLSPLISKQSKLRADTSVVKSEMGCSDAPQATPSDTSTGELEHKDASIQPTASITSASSPRLAHGWTTVIQAINGKDHMKSLKRTRGVGSAKHDSSQKSINSFFKKQKT